VVAQDEKGGDVGDLLAEIEKAMRHA
jgi:hypothetical protein